MSDEQAAVKEAEVSQQKTAEQVAAEGQQKRLWIVSIFLDPETGACEMQTNENVKSQWQVDCMLAQLAKKIQMTAFGRVTADMMQAVVASGAKKPGLFGKK